MRDYLEISCQLLKTNFGPETLTIFCFDHVSPVYRQFQAGTSHSAKINLLIKYYQTRDELTTLATLLQQQPTGAAQPSVPGNSEPQLRPDFGDKLLEILLTIPALQDSQGRKILVRNLPAGPVNAIPQGNSMLIDLDNIISAAKSWGKLSDSNEWALVIIANNALRFFAKGTQQGRNLETLLAERFKTRA